MGELSLEPEIETLSRTCTALNPSNQLDHLSLKDENCASSEEECRANTLCCEGKCRGLPELPEDIGMKSEQDACLLIER